MELARIGGRIAELFISGITYTIAMAKLSLASAAMLALSEAVRGAYTYIEDCARSVDNLAETASTLWVEGEVVNAHRDAATVMRGVLADAESLANEAQEMAADFQSAQQEHEDDYGPVHEVMTTKPGAVADRTYYSNR